MPCLSASVLSHTSLEASFPDCHRHTDRQTDRQTGPVAVAAHALTGCSPAGRDWEGVFIGLMTTPSWHSVHMGVPSQPRHMSTWGEGGPQGPRATPGAAREREGRGGWNRVQAGRVCGQEAVKHSEVREVPETGRGSEGSGGECSRPPELTRLGPPGGPRTAERHTH